MHNLLISTSKSAILGVNVCFYHENQGKLAINKESLRIRVVLEHFLLPSRACLIGVQLRVKPCDISLLGVLLPSRAW